MRMSRGRTVLVAALMTSAALVTVGTSAEAAEPGFQLPFPCGQTWHGTSGSPAHHAKREIDFNRGAKPDSDLRAPVAAAAGGTVRTASYQKSSGFGNLVKIEHRDGWFTFYAHLDSIAVAAGDKVARGQVIGKVGKTSAKYSVTPHLHYEVRLGASGYPGNLRAARFDGAVFDYPAADITSKNC